MTQSGKVFCGLHFTLFLEIMDVMSSGPKRKGLSRLLSEQSQHLWWYGGVLVTMASWVTCTSVNAPLMLRCTYRFWSNMCCHGWQCLFQRRPCLFQQDNARPHSARVTTVWLRSKRVRVLACLHSRPVSNQVQNMTTEPWIVKQLKSYIKQEWERIPPYKASTISVLSSQTLIECC